MAALHNVVMLCWEQRDATGREEIIGFVPLLCAGTTGWPVSIKTVLAVAEKPESNFQFFLLCLVSVGLMGSGPLIFF